MSTERSYTPPIEWTPYLDAKLTEARVGGRLGWKRVGEVMGFADSTCERRARALGIAAPLRRLGRLTPAVRADIVRRRAAGETYRAIGAALDIPYTCAFHAYQDAISSAASQAATEVRQGPDALAPGALQGAVPSVPSPNVQLASLSDDSGAVSFGAGDEQ